MSEQTSPSLSYCYYLIFSDEIQLFGQLLSLFLSDSFKSDFA